MRRPAVALAVCSAVIAIAGAPGVTARTFRPPFVAADAFVTGLTTCGPGPIGMLFDGASFFVTDYCNGTTYRMSPNGGPVGTAQAAVANGLTHGLALTHGRYYGAATGRPPLARGVYAFGPGTLAIGHKVFDPPGEPRGVVGDPKSTDLVVSTSNGLFRVHDPDSGNPSSTKVADGEFDGVAVTADGARVYVTDFARQRVLGFSRAGVKVFDVFVGHGADGIAVARDGDLYVNANDGTVLRLATAPASVAPVTVVSTGGARGDFVTVGPDGCLYATQPATIERFRPCFFEPTVARPARGRSWVWLVGALLALVLVGIAVARLARRR